MMENINRNWRKGQQLKPIPCKAWPWLYAAKVGDKHMCAPNNAKVTLLESVGPRKVCRALYNGREVRIHSYEWCLREPVWKRFIMFVKDELGY